MQVKMFQLYLIYIWYNNPTYNSEYILIAKHALNCICSLGRYASLFQ